MIIVTIIYNNFQLISGELQFRFSFALVLVRANYRKIIVEIRRHKSSSSFTICFFLINQLICMILNDKGCSIPYKMARQMSSKRCRSSQHCIILLNEKNPNYLTHLTWSKMSKLHEI